MTELLPAPMPSTARPRRRAALAGNRSTRLDRELDQLRGHLRDSALPPGAAPTLSDLAVILENISGALLDITRLFHTYQILQAAGEPLADYLEQSLADLARDLEDYDRSTAVSGQP